VRDYLRERKLRNCVNQTALEAAERRADHS